MKARTRGGLATALRNKPGLIATCLHRGGDFTSTSPQTDTPNTLHPPRSLLVYLADICTSQPTHRDQTEPEPAMQIKYSNIQQYQPFCSAPTPASPAAPRAPPQARRRAREGIGSRKAQRFAPAAPTISVHTCRAQASVSRRQIPSPDPPLPF